MSNTRIITVVATKNGKITKFLQNTETLHLIKVVAGKPDESLGIVEEIKTWRVLKNILLSDGYDLQNLKATENVNKTTLEHIDAVLPEGDFRLFLRPSETKSGGFDVAGKGFKDLRALVTTDEIKNHLNTIVPGKNWTQLSTADLAKGLESFGGSSTTSAPTVQEVTNDVTAVAETGEEVKLNPLGKAKLAKQLIEEVCKEVEDEDSEICERVEMATDELDTLIELLEDVYDDEGQVTAAPTSREEKAERLEQEEIAREMRELEDGF